MQAYRVETTVASDGSLIIKHLPLPAGEAVEVIILVHEQKEPTGGQYSLHGTPVVYHKPFDPVGEEDWNVLQ